jgi:predicted PurR-regulated permease PerM
VDRAYRTAAGITAVVIAILLGLWLVVLLRTLVLVLVVSAIVAAAFDRPVRWMQRRLHLPRWAAVALVSLLSVGVLVGVGALIAQPFSSQSKVLKQGLPAEAQRLKDLPVVGPRLRNVDLQATTERFLRDLPKRLQAHRDLVLGVAQTTFTVLAGLGTIAVTVVFMLLKGPQMARGASELILDDVRRLRARRIGRGMLEAVSGYVLGNLLISLLASIVTVITLAVMHVPFIPVLAVIMFVLDLLPVVGATLGGVVVAAATFILDPHPLKALVFIGVFVVYQEIESHTIYPLIMGRSVKVGAFTVFLMSLAGAELAGILGALLAIPVGAALNVVVRDIVEERKARGGLVAAKSLEVVERPVVSLTVEAHSDREGGKPQALVDPQGQPLVVRHDLDGE